VYKNGNDRLMDIISKREKNLWNEEKHNFICAPRDTSLLVYDPILCNSRISRIREDEKWTFAESVFGKSARVWGENNVSALRLVYIIIIRLYFIFISYTTLEWNQTGLYKCVHLTENLVASFIIYTHNSYSSFLRMFWPPPYQQGRAVRVRSRTEKGNNIGFFLF
jgi:hypothetical protein